MTNYEINVSKVKENMIIIIIMLNCDINEQNEGYCKSKEV